MNQPASAKAHTSSGAWRRTAIIISAICGLIIIVGPGLKLISVIKNSTNAMEPAIRPGQQVISERFSYLYRDPKRYEVIIFSTKGLPGLQQDQLFVKRVIGLPGERVKFQHGKLLIKPKTDEIHLIITNEAGPLRFPTNTAARGSMGNVDILLGPTDYYVIGDNLTNSLDSRYFGSVPRKNISARLIGL